MPRLKNIFTQVMDKESDKAYVREGFTRHVENLRFHTNDGNDGVGTNIKGSLEISDSTEDRNDLKCVTAIHNGDLDVIYYYLASTEGLFSKIVEYNIETEVTTDILKDTLGVLNLDKGGYITGINEINGLLYWSEWGNNPRRLNVERAKSYGTNGFTEDDIKVIVKPPMQKLKIELARTDTYSDQENFIEKKFLSFSYRYRYLDGEYSVLAPFTLAAFKPKRFRYDFAEQSNRSMVNDFNQVNIDFWTGNERVTEIQLVFIESESNSLWLIDDFDKSKMGYADNTIQRFEFFNNKTKRALPNRILRSFYDNVPLTAKSQELIDGRLLYGFYKENYDIVDDQGKEIEIDYSLDLVMKPNTVDKAIDTYDSNGNVIGTEIIQVPSGFPEPTVKSNRDYEVGIVYGDNDGRITTILTSKTNTVYIPNSASVTENSIDVVLDKDQKPPAFASWFKFFVKQLKKGYDQILPMVFYEDGAYRWIKLEGADKDKVSEGDYLIVKSDTQGALENLTRVKVLEKTVQEKNFLEPKDTGSEILQESGLYFKIKPERFRVDLDDYDTYTLSAYDNNSASYSNPVRDAHQYISEPHYYGDSNLNDLTSNSPFTGGSGVFTGNGEKRFIIKIDGVAPNTFKWSDDGGVTFPNTEIAITAGTEQLLSDGVAITFENNIGHSVNDEWAINARSNWDFEGGRKAYGFYRVAIAHDDVLESKGDETIESGARISLEYDEYGSRSQKFRIDNVSSDRYDNIQEWFIKEDIMTQISAQTNLTLNEVHFMRGHLGRKGNSTWIRQEDTEGTMTMLVKAGFGKPTSKVLSNSEIVQNQSGRYLVFETEPSEVASEFFEVGKTYKIANGFHTSRTDYFETEIPNISTDQDQTTYQDLRIKLDWFNAFSYGNAVESYKIQDEFNQKGIDIGVRPLAEQKTKYEQVIREADITWSDVYESETGFNGLNSFNLSLSNFIKLDKENGSIQKLHSQNTNILVLQEDALGVMPYNKNIIYDAEGGKTVGISTNILDERSYRPYDSGRHGISKNPESFVRDGSRSYFTDQQRGNLLRLANNGITAIDMNLMQHEFSKFMNANKNNKMVGGYDSKHGEYILHLPSEEKSIVFKEVAKGFPNHFTYEPDFILGANNELYAWKNGVMYKMNATENRNEYFGKQYNSFIKFFVNIEASTEKVFHAIGLETTHAWLVDLKTNLTSRTIFKESFLKKEDYWFSEIMGNTNGDVESSSIFGLGNYPVLGGVINANRLPDTISVGDVIVSTDASFAPNTITNIQGSIITLENPINFAASRLMYSKNSSIEGASIRGDVLEVSMTNSDTEKTEIRAVNLEVAKSPYT